MQKGKTTATEISPEDFERRGLVLAETQEHRFHVCQDKVREARYKERHKLQNHSLQEI